MPSLQPVQPGPVPCRCCGAPASGPCATCSDMICADCGVLTGGVVSKVVVCPRCSRQGRGTVGWRAWASVLVPIAVGLGIMLGIAALLR